MRICALLISVALFGCSNGYSCAPARANPSPDCPDGTFSDASVNDTTCLDPNGVPFCRAPTDLCLVCTGSDFPDGCRVHSTGNNYECVHRCSAC